MFCAGKEGRSRRRAEAPETSSGKREEECEERKGLSNEKPIALLTVLMLLGLLQTAVLAETAEETLSLADRLEADYVGPLLPVGRALVAE